MKNITIENRQVRHEYFIDSTYEAGVELKGNEVKSIRSGMMNLKGSWISIENGECFLKGANITPWETSNTFDIKQNRDIKLLLHKKEIRELGEAVKIKGKTLVPIKVYFGNSGKCKVQVGVCTGKKLHDKRESAKAATMKREAEIYK